VDALACAERWLAARPDDAGLLYSLGRQCMAAQIWGKAQTYLEQSLRIAPAADAHLALGELFEQLGRPADAAVQFRTAAQLGFAHPMGLPKRNEVVPVA
jgi:HemY protein